MDSQYILVNMNKFYLNIRITAKGDVRKQLLKVQGENKGWVGVFDAFLKDFTQTFPLYLSLENALNQF